MKSRTIVTAISAQVKVLKQVDFQVAEVANNFRLILSKNQKKPGFSFLVNRVEYKFLITLGLALLVLVLPLKTRAASLFGKVVQADTEETITNTQTLPLLQGYSSPELKSTGGPEIVATDDGLLMPSAGPMGTAADLADEEISGGEISLYVVKDGDTLASIASMFGVSVNTIVWANDHITGNKLKTGDVLTILPITGVYYEIKKGDTLESIAKKFGGDVTEIRRFNDLPSDAKLTIGDSIIIPNGDVHLAEEPKKKLVTNVSKALINLPTVPASFYNRPIADGFKWRKSQGFHWPFSAIDIAAPTGTPILASAAGEIIRAKNSGWNGGYGKMVVVRHDNGTQTLYAHLNKALVNLGDRVTQGQLIGLVGSTGRSTGPHLHFEIRGAKARPILSALY